VLSNRKPAVIFAFFYTGKPGSPAQAGLPGLVKAVIS